MPQILWPLEFQCCNSATLTGSNPQAFFFFFNFAHRAWECTQRKLQMEWNFAKSALHAKCKFVVKPHGPIYDCSSQWKHTCTQILLPCCLLKLSLPPPQFSISPVLCLRPCLSLSRSLCVTRISPSPNQYHLPSSLVPPSSEACVNSIGHCYVTVKLYPWCHVSRGLSDRLTSPPNAHIWFSHGSNKQTKQKKTEWCSKRDCLPENHVTHTNHDQIQTQQLQNPSQNKGIST